MNCTLYKRKYTMTAGNRIDMIYVSIISSIFKSANKGLWNMKVVLTVLS